MVDAQVLWAEPVHRLVVEVPQGEVTLIGPILGPDLAQVAAQSSSTPARG